MPDKRIHITKHWVLTPDKKRLVFVLMTDYYDKRLSYFLELFEEAKKDFPELKAKQVNAQYYNSDVHKGHRGIEFSMELPVGIPDGYVDGLFLVTTY